MNRVEKKFIIENSFDSKKILFYLSKNFVIKKKFENREINSIYLDTTNYDYMSDNLDGIKNRIKSRLRFYSGSNNQFVYEEKIKKNEIGFKKKLYFDIGETEKLDWDICLAKFKESHLFLTTKFYLRESLFVKYNREYMIDLFGNSITMDTNIKFYDVKYFNKPIIYEKSVIEYKIEEENFKKKLFYNFKLRNSRHSKYVVGMALLNKTLYI